MPCARARGTSCCPPEVICGTVFENVAALLGPLLLTVPPQAISRIRPPLLTVLPRAVSWAHPFSLCRLETLRGPATPMLPAMPPSPLYSWRRIKAFRGVTSRSSCLCGTDPRFITCGFEQGWSGLVTYTAPIWGLSREPKNKKSACIAIFLRLGTVVGCLIADWDAKTQVIGCTVALFRCEGTKKSPQSQKSCKEARIFVFVIAELP